MIKNPKQITALLLKREFQTTWALSLVVGILMAGTSLVGLIFPSSLYPSPEFVRAFRVNDAINLLVGLPGLLGSLWLVRRGRLVGMLLWPGALLYVLYNYLAYTFGMPLRWITLAFLLLVLLSAALLIDLLKNIDHQAVRIRLAGKVPEKSGWLLFLFGVAFFLRAVVTLGSTIFSQATLPLSEIGVLVADIALSVPWAISGIWLLRRQPFGYGSGLGFLFALTMLFTGLILLLLLQPLLTEAPFDLESVLTILGMGLICSVPFGLFVRAVLSTE